MLAASEGREDIRDGRLLQVGQSRILAVGREHGHGQQLVQCPLGAGMSGKDSSAPGSGVFEV